jgi:adenylosuccinate lyase
MPRDDAYKAVQENAMAAWESDTSFQERVSKDDRIAKVLDSKALAHTFELQRQLRYVDAIFDRVFGAHPAGEKSGATSVGKN